MKWEKMSLGEIVSLKRGYDLPSQKRKNGMVPIISSSGITDFHSEPAKTGCGGLGCFQFIPTGGSGEHLVVLLAVRPCIGSSPRVWGTPRRRVSR